MFIQNFPKFWGADFRKSIWICPFTLLFTFMWLHNQILCCISVVSPASRQPNISISTQNHPVRADTSVAQGISAWQGNPGRGSLPFFSRIPAERTADSVKASLLAIHTEGRRALVTPEPRQQGDNETSAQTTAAWLRKSIGDSCSESGSCYEICLPQRIEICPWWGMSNTPVTTTLPCYIERLTVKYMRTSHCSNACAARPHPFTANQQKGR